ncbi:hypothetical protein C8A01DRAFT_35355 [Parachaetomium inaequale]|uniref:Uncharacterized protein n=1 Tax=Parachaetomium inaequale TaxID=2588326 RepID=A0AAN6PGL6_9PEZI|nr:hypothetical protein C8A01DRAFT_35355 [Parachaetomium inaequale]
MEWKDTYDANADPYESAGKIKKWYRNGYVAEVDWSSDEVRQLFQIQTANTTSASPSPQAESASAPVGAIAGGVVGGVAGLAAMAAVAWLVVRRRRRTRKGQEADLADAKDSGMPELNTASDYAELNGGRLSGSF